MSAYAACWCLTGIALLLILGHAALFAVVVLAVAVAVALTSEDEAHRDARRRNAR